MLAGRLTPKFCSHTIPKIKIAGGTLSQNPQRIMEAFQEFYHKLYGIDRDTTQSGLVKFLDSIQSPKLEN